MIKKEVMLQLFEQNNGVLSSQQLVSNGIYYYNIQQFLDSGLIIKIKQGLYRLNSGVYDERTEIMQIVPKGVFCLLSAAFFYELSTFIPSQYQIAIPRKSKIVLPSYPPIQLFYWKEYSLGQSLIQVQEATIRIYAIEKTICDIFRYRETIGTDTTKEILKNYLAKKDRNLALLSEYAKEMKIYSKLFPYLEILL